MGPLSPGQAPGWFLRSEKRLRRPGAARSREISTTAEPRYVSTHVQHFQAVLGRVSDMRSIAKKHNGHLREEVAAVKLCLDVRVVPY